jgi:integrase
MRDFIRWLAGQKGFRNRLVATDAEYFNPSRHDEAIARAQRPMKVPELWQIEAVVDAMPSSTIIERRNRAIVALIILTGARDNAVASLRLGDLDLEGQELFQDSRHVRTKFRKAYSTWFFPVGGKYVDIVTNWVSELASVRGSDPAIPLFPRTETRFGKDGTTPETHLGSEGWANADPIRKLFKEACKAVGMPDFKPHSLRHMLARVGEQRAASAEDMKSWSQNLGHENMLTTFTSYGQVPPHRQKEVVLRMTEPVT